MGFKRIIFMLESKRDRACISNSNQDSLRESRPKLRRTFFSYIKSVSRRFSGVEGGRVLGTMDAKIPENVQSTNKNMKEQVQKTREEQFLDGIFQWVKTERAGDICKFQEFSVVSDIEYVVFTDGSRVASSLLGDVVLMHQHESQVITDLNGFSPQPTQPVQSQPVYVAPVHNVQAQISTNPVLAILEKSKKKTEKITITLTVKIPSPELYSVIRENFSGVDEIILQNVIEQVQGKMLQNSMKRELQNIYNPKKKKT